MWFLMKCFLLCVGGWSFDFEACCDFKSVIVVPSIVFSRNFTRVRKKCDLSGTAYKFSLNKIWNEWSKNFASEC